MKAASIDIYQIVTDQIIALLEKGTIPWRKQWTSPELPANAFTKREYRGFNLLYLSCLPYELPRFLTWKQIHEVGGSVKHGEHGHMIVYWQIKKCVSSEETTIPNEKEPKPKMLLRYYKVFNISQCYDLPETMTTLPALGSITSSLPVHECEAIIQGMPNKPRIHTEGSQPCYVPSIDMVRMPHQNQFESASAYFGTLFHELVHSTGHKSRLHRDLADLHSMRTDSYAAEELTAEVGACFLNRHAGILSTEVENSTAYISGWLTRLRNDKRFILQASAKAQQAVDYILNVRSES